MSNFSIQKEREWYREDIKNILDFFNSSKNGLTEHRYQKNLKQYGRNLLKETKSRGSFEIFISQFKSPLVYILLVAAVIVFFLKDYIDAYIILGIVLLNAIIGTAQEGKAENTLLALKKVVKSYATVLRNGEKITVDDSELVPGDIILLKDGLSVPADARLIESNSLKVNQSALTGESEIVFKEAHKIAGTNVPVADRSNMIFRGTYIVSGLGKAIVVRTGTETIIGQIAQKLSELKIDVPLKRNIEKLSNLIVIIMVFISVILFSYGVFTGRGIFEMFLTVVAVAVSAIPESLPVVVTLVLAAGVWRMSKRNVLVKKLQAVEALGQASVIAVDKTGTITKNQMMVGKIFVNDRYIDVTGEGYNPKGKFTEKNELILNPENDSDLSLIAKTSALTAIAEIQYSKEEKEYLLKSGDPTEASLIVLGEKIGHKKTDLENLFPKIFEIPFDFNTKHHTTINNLGDKEMMFSAGSPEVILENSTHIWKENSYHIITNQDKKKIENAMNDFANQGYRILALAIKENPKDFKMHSMTFLGLVGISDSIREEVYQAVTDVRNANMKVVMITGDYHNTAEAIAKKVGIFKTGDIILTGPEINELPEDALLEKLDKVTVFARVTPDHKMKIIDLFKKKGEVIAMTGDGINDAIALTAADLGVAMGKEGTEVAREAADLVLVDDNFSSIIAAAEEGRNIYWTIRKTILYLLSTNIGELLVIAIAIFLNMPLPLLATQIIWLNLVTDSFLVAALAVDPREKNIMSNLFRRPSKNLIDKLMITRIVMVSITMAIATLLMFSQYAHDLDNLEKAWTISLTMLTVFQWYNIFNIRSHFCSIFNKNLWNNKWLILGVLIAVGLHFFAIYTPFMQKILRTTALNWQEWIMILSIGLSVILFEEIRKFFYRLKMAKLSKC